MFVKKIDVQNFRLFSSESNFSIDNLNIPDGSREGSGLTVFVGENGCGKTTILDSLALPLLEYKADSFSIDDLNDPKQPCLISVYSENSFKVLGTMPNSSFQAKGFLFKAKMRDRVSRNYLSSFIVSDQLFIRENDNKPKDGSPDLRVSVNNPFSGKRFSENDILFLDRNRYYQIRSGSFNQTRFDRLMEDLDYQYVKGKKDDVNVNSMFSEEISKADISTDYLKEALETFKLLTGISVNLDFIDNYHPFKTAAFVQRKQNGQQIKIDSIGSGYEMIFSLIYSYQLSLQSGKQLIVLIDEPELHMHPSLQEKLVSFLLQISKNAQIFITTHSPLLIKQISGNEYTKILILRNDKTATEMEGRKLPYLSANETNYLAFELATEEYHNELYEYLKSCFGENLRYKVFDETFFIRKHGELKDSPWMGHQNEVSKHTYIRNQIHHASNNGKPIYSVLKESIERMRAFCDDENVKG